MKWSFLIDFVRFISKAGRKKLTKTSKNPPCFRTSLSEGPVRNSDFWSISSDSLSGNSMSESRDLFCTDPRRPHVIYFQIFQNFEWSKRSFYIETFSRNFFPKRCMAFRSYYFRSSRILRTLENKSRPFKISIRLIVTGHRGGSRGRRASLRDRVAYVSTRGRHWRRGGKLIWYGRSSAWEGRKFSPRARPTQIWAQLVILYATDRMTKKDFNGWSLFWINRPQNQEFPNFKTHFS